MTTIGKLQNYAPLKPKKKVERATIYTDGACSPNPGPGGWGCIIVHHHGEPTKLSGYFPYTTNNRMELVAAIKALQHLRGEHRVTLYSDSRYLVQSMKGKYKRNHNADLWDELDSLNSHHCIRWQWVKAHNGDPLNEECDKLATAAMEGDSE